MPISDVMIHVPQPLSRDARGALEDSLRDVPGVVAPRFNPGREHLLLVAFDPDKIGPAELLKAVRAAGGDARLVGL
jgi:hypothetical protein